MIQGELFPMPRQTRPKAFNPAKAARCPHKNLGSVVGVDVWDADTKMAAYVAKIQVRCKDCGVFFRFMGAPGGASFFQPTVTPEGTELRAPCEPAVVRELVDEPRPEPS